MKIKISDKESYIIEIPEEINITELYGIVMKLTDIQKFCGKYVSNDIQIPIKQRMKQHRLSKEEAMIYINRYYKSKEERHKLVEESNTTAGNVGKRVYYNANKYHIKVSSKLFKDKIKNNKENKRTVWVNYLTTYYTNNEERQLLAKKLNMTITNLKSRITYYRNAFKIKPTEVGLTHFPKVGHGLLNDNFNIKQK